MQQFSTSPFFPDEEKGESDTATQARFENLDLHPKSLKALRRHGLHNMTEIQERTFEPIVSGKDVVGRARTGTGKTLGFLLPALERIIRQEDQLQPGVKILVLSPTRELAAQISKEADRLIASHSNINITSQVVYGGSSKQEDINRFTRQLPTILVATPGRLKDHLTDTTSIGGKPFIDAVRNLHILILDETDRLLDMGFRRDIQDILSCLPSKNKRQTLLFSATLPSNVREMVNMAIRPNYQIIDCIQDEDPTSQTNINTEQANVVLPSDRFWTGSMEHLLNLIDERNNKVMVFFPMTSLIQLYASIFNIRFGRRVLELHGRMHQRERTTISRRFRNASKGVLFTSDVSARGVDYPNVTHVIQIGASESRETYIHRLGRTGRAGKRGKGLLILPEVERSFLDELEGLNVPLDPQLQECLSGTPSKRFMDEFGPLAQRIQAGRDRKLERLVCDSYQAMIPYYIQRTKNSALGKDVVALSNSLVEDMGITELPVIDASRARRIGIDTISGLNISSGWNEKNWSDSWTSPPSQKKPFGKPFGDFEGNFDSVGSVGKTVGGPRGKYRAWNGYDPGFDPVQRDRSRDPVQRDCTSQRNDHGKRWQTEAIRSAGASRRKKHSAGRRDDWNTDRPDTVGWKDGGATSHPRTSWSKKNKSSSFIRWEVPGEFSKKH